MVDRPRSNTKYASYLQIQINGDREMDLSHRSGSGSRQQTAGDEHGMRLLSP
ncbi:MAG: hypothetical protein ACM3ML_30370 [Micromonosporaceae bacterium]